MMIPSYFFNQNFGHAYIIVHIMQARSNLYVWFLFLMFQFNFRDR